MITKQPFRELTFVLGTFEAVAQHIFKGIGSKSQVILPCDLNNVANLAQTPALRPAYAKVDIVTTDGMPLVWWWRKKLAETSIIVERVYGPDLMLKLLSLTQDSKYRHFFYGSSSSTLRCLKAELKNRSFSLKIVGMESPPYRALSVKEKNAYLYQIKKSNTTVLWLGIGSPEQVKVAAEWKAALPKVTIICVGAAFDFIAKTKPSAPLWMKKNGLEWLYRLQCEPQRLGKRYLWEIPLFLIKEMKTN